MGDNEPRQERTPVPTMPRFPYPFEPLARFERFSKRSPHASCQGRAAGLRTKQCLLERGGMNGVIFEGMRKVMVPEVGLEPT
jgi:hypothetical protein